ncbi:hypothetical protein OG592_03955 [Streptomyces avidinii]|nr:hypothetical protein OG592_03955 [Streptomyces avidinii]
MRGPVLGLGAHHHQLRVEEDAGVVERIEIPPQPLAVGPQIAGRRGEQRASSGGLFRDRRSPDESDAAVAGRGQGRNGLAGGFTVVADDRVEVA